MFAEDDADDPNYAAHMAMLMDAMMESDLQESQCGMVGIQNDSL